MHNEPTDSDPSMSQAAVNAYPDYDDDRVDLVDFVSRMWASKSVIAASFVVCTVLGALFAFLASPVYRAEAVLAPNQPDERVNLPTGLGALSGLGGFNLVASVDNQEALAILSSRVFVEDFIQDRNLLPVLFASEWDEDEGKWVDDDPESWPDIREGVSYFIEDIRTVSEDAATGIVTLGIEWSDAAVAADWAEDLVKRINERLRARDLSESEQKLAYLNEQLAQASLVELRQSISRLIENEVQTITLAKAESEYAYRVIDPPRIPKAPIFPKRIPIIIIAMMFGGMVGIGLVLLRGWTRQVDNRPRYVETGQ